MGVTFYCMIQPITNTQSKQVLQSKQRCNKRNRSSHNSYCTGPTLDVCGSNCFRRGSSSGSRCLRARSHRSSRTGRRLGSIIRSRLTHTLLNRSRRARWQHTRQPIPTNSRELDTATSTKSSSLGNRVTESFSTRQVWGGGNTCKVSAAANGRRNRGLTFVAVSTRCRTHFRSLRHCCGSSDGHSLTGSALDCSRYRLWLNTRQSRVADGGVCNTAATTSLALVGELVTEPFASRNRLGKNAGETRGAFGRCWNRRLANGAVSSVVGLCKSSGSKQRREHDGGNHCFVLF
ncbi:hypothetical protein BJ741DRAFT_622219 [Chytriomyces cf. hyalinus JEL632]|nr:hypothetical protein BJ741DRAFT_622219 [Chytriomyces cf. hyalinus JEL632]